MHVEDRRKELVQVLAPVHALLIGKAANVLLPLVLDLIVTTLLMFVMVKVPVWIRTLVHALPIMLVLHVNIQNVMESVHKILEQCVMVVVRV